MPDLLLYFSTAGVLAPALGRGVARFAPGAGRGARPRAAELRLEIVLVPVALVLHGMLLYRRVIVPDGLDLGVANAISMLVWLTVLIYWLAGLAYQGLAAILGLMSPVALVAVLLQVAIPTHHIVTYGGDPLFTLHFVIAMLAYSLFIVATVHALVMLAEEKWLHRGVLPPFLQAPAAAARDGGAALPHPARRLRAAHAHARERRRSSPSSSSASRSRSRTRRCSRSSRGSSSAACSSGHYFRGWRGRKAVNWTLAGFTALLLAYVGSKVVLELSSSAARPHA